MPTRKNFRERRQTRREEAEKRAKARIERTEAAQIELLRTKPGASYKEIARLSAKMLSEK